MSHSKVVGGGKCVYRLSMASRSPEIENLWLFSAWRAKLSKLANVGSHVRKFAENVEARAFGFNVVTDEFGELEGFAFAFGSSASISTSFGQCNASSAFEVFIVLFAVVVVFLV